MSTRIRAGRFLLVLTYALTTVLVDGAHRHAPDGDDAAKCEATCRAPGPHLSGHSSPDLTQVHPDCPACHFRNATYAPEGAIATRIAPLVGHVHALVSIGVAGEAPLIPSVRGPPRA